MQNHKHTNSLIHETSPYLLQHAHNPVNWLAWNDITLEKAKQENKLILISVGYSACHWCHVMEHESFEDETVAKIMNDYFVCIKIDREERPDIDQVYMMAVQLMTGQGGWPLNCFALPDGRPIYGGTYFPKQNWINILLNLVDLQKQEPEKIEEYAKQLTQGIKLAELVKVNTSENKFDEKLIHRCYNNWKVRFDNIEGGPDKAPKFPLPNNYQFLLRLATSPSPFQGEGEPVLSLSKEDEVLEHVNLTLTKMAYGGIYDQIGGGFARYSVDHYWKVPHFEKMLYDNAQLVSLYSEAYVVTKNSLYKQIVYQTLEFIERELTSPKGGFYSALDADSEGVEGKYYVWTKEELQRLLKDKFELFADYFNINERGLWEHGNYILLRRDDDTSIAKKHNITLNELQAIITESKNTLLAVREKRIKPGLDNKVLTSWNALMIKGYIDASNAFEEQHFLDVAIKNTSFLLEKSLVDKNTLIHTIGKTQIGFLEDYSFFIETLIALYQATFKDLYLQKANELMSYCITHFQDKETNMFFFTSDLDKALITRKMEISDNVIPASNSSISKSLFYLGHYFEDFEFVALSKKMLNNMLSEIETYGAGYSNWAMLYLHFIQPFSELAIVGKDVDEKKKELNKTFLPNVIFVGSKGESTLPLLKNRFKKEETLIYVCSSNTCKEPVKTVEEALKQLI